MDYWRDRRRFADWLRENSEEINKRKKKMRISQQTQVTFTVGDSRNDLVSGIQNSASPYTKVTGVKVNDNGSVTVFFATE